MNEIVNKSKLDNVNSINSTFNKVKKFKKEKIMNGTKKRKSSLDKNLIDQSSVDDNLCLPKDGQNREKKIRCEIDSAQSNCFEKLNIIIDDEPLDDEKSDRISFVGERISTGVDSESERPEKIDDETIINNDESVSLNDKLNIELESNLHHENSKSVEDNDSSSSELGIRSEDEDESDDQHIENGDKVESEYEVIEEEISTDESDLSSQKGKLNSIDEQMQNQPQNIKKFTRRIRRESNQNRRKNENELELRFLISRRDAGALIGKKGTVIRELRQTFKCSILIPDCGNENPERVLKICAPSNVMDEILRKIIEIIIDRSNSSSGQAQTTAGGNEKIELRMLIHSSHAGSIIGRKGVTIKHLRDISKTAIKIFSMCCPSSNERIIAIKGQPQVVVDTIKLIRGTIKGTKGPIQPYNPLNYDVHTAEEYGGFLQDQSDEFSIISSSSANHVHNAPQQQYQLPAHNFQSSKNHHQWKSTFVSPTPASHCNIDGRQSLQFCNHNAQVVLGGTPSHHPSSQYNSMMQPQIPHTCQCQLQRHTHSVTPALSHEHAHHCNVSPYSVPHHFKTQCSHYHHHHQCGNDGHTGQNCGQSVVEHKQPQRSTLVSRRTNPVSSTQYYCQ